MSVRNGTGKTLVWLFWPRRGARRPRCCPSPSRLPKPIATVCPTFCPTNSAVCCRPPPDGPGIVPCQGSICRRTSPHPTPMIGLSALRSTRHTCTTTITSAIAGGSNLPGNGRRRSDPTLPIESGSKCRGARNLRTCAVWTRPRPSAQRPVETKYRMSRPRSGCGTEEEMAALPLAGGRLVREGGGAEGARGGSRRDGTEACKSG